MFLHAALPLTLTLYPGEREPVSPGAAQSLGTWYSPRRGTVLPLPGGEGWGEGEGTVDQTETPAAFTH
jgi:hypothetical protein